MRCLQSLTIAAAITLVLCFVPCPCLGVETLTISPGAPTVASTPLQEGRQYTIEASGTYAVNLVLLQPVGQMPSGTRFDIGADPEWFQETISRPGDDPAYYQWIEKEIVTEGYIDDDIYDLTLNGQFIDWLGTSDGTHFSTHTFSPNHVYRHNVTGTGSALEFAIYNPYETNEYQHVEVIGSLDVTITSQQRVALVWDEPVPKGFSPVYDSKSVF